ncbi:MAG: hypothetical protein WED33_08595 [Bacteroidia bacterium]
MNVVLRNIFVLSLILIGNLLFSQPEEAIRQEIKNAAKLVLIDRPIMEITTVSWDSSQVYYVKSGKRKQKEMEISKVYSVIDADAKETVIYVQDTLENNWYTAEQMKEYMLGQEDARKAYKEKANRTAAGGVMFGFIGSATGLFYGPLFVIGYTAWKGNTKPSQKEEFGFNAEFANNPYYVEGFGTMAKRYTIRRSALGSAAGYILGAVTLSLVIR